MSLYGPIHDLVYGLLPPMQIRVGPAEFFTAVGLLGLINFEIRLWRRHR